MLQYFDRGAEGIQQLEQGVTRSIGYIDDAAIVGMAATSQHIRELSLAMRADIYSVINPAVDAAVVKITQLVESLTADNIRTGVTKVGDAAIGVAETIAELAVIAKDKLDELLKSIEDLADKAKGFFGWLDKSAGVLNNLAAGNLDQVDAAAAKLLEHMGLSWLPGVKAELNALGQAGADALDHIDRVSPKTVGELDTVRAAAVAVARLSTT